MKKYLPFMLTVLACMVLGGELTYYFRPEKEVQVYPPYIEHMSGSSIYLQSYNAITMDGGNQWYAVERHEDSGGFTILGKAEEYYGDGWLDVLSLHRLADYVQQYGPITIGGELTEEEQELLDQADVTFSENE